MAYINIYRKGSSAVIANDLNFSNVRAVVARMIDLAHSDLIHTR